MRQSFDNALAAVLVLPSKSFGLEPKVLRPPLANAGVNRARGQSSDLTCLRKRHLRIAERYHPHGSRVAPLLFSRGPAAVSRLVVPIVVYALKRPLWRALAHVGQKPSEAISPRGAYRNAASAIVLELNNVGVEASPLHCRPHAIHRRPARSVSGRPCGYFRSHLAATTFGSAATQIIQDCDVRFPAIAQAFPITMPPVAANELKRDKVSEPLTGNVASFGHHPILSKVLSERKPK